MAKKQQHNQQSAKQTANSIKLRFVSPPEGGLDLVTNRKGAI